MFGRKPRIAVRLEAYGLAARLVRPGEYELPAGSKLKALLKAAGLPRGGPPLVCMIAGDRVERSHALAGGEAVKVFHVAGGG